MASAPWYKMPVDPELLAIFREYLGDLPQYNDILGGDDGIEASDSKLKMSLQMFVSHFNAAPPALDTQYKVSDFPDGQLLLQGAAVQVLVQMGLIHTRNKVNYSDQGFTFDQWDKAPEYQNWMLQLQAQVDQAVSRLKIALNAEEATDFIGSPDEVFWS